MKEIHSAIEVTTNGASILCGKERWKEADGARLQVSKRMDNQEQLSTPFDIRYLGKYWDEENVYKDGFEVRVQQCEN